ncbi:hypothetical protein MKK67_14645 [Methylobacterium sp. J-072]|uniref:hypothetical protein n=1 Tax=Methylobacterium sp. J-072 TaxID=2836651 RepID=UPI001FB9A6EB|nr:hypothetical protein [Methylobacterium sp. J-072]MCJ2093718.1 hypothetical protein [Methylobacterium sp. J-072]
MPDLLTVGEKCPTGRIYSVEGNRSISVAEVNRKISIFEKTDWSVTDAPIQAYLPNRRLRACTAQITPLQLAAFTSGMPELPG